MAQNSFPENPLGLTNGSVLEAVNPIVWQIGMMPGDKITLTYDGQYICFGPYTWSISGIVREIEMGVWKVI